MERSQELPGYDPHRDDPEWRARAASAHELAARAAPFGVLKRLGSFPVKHRQLWERRHGRVPATGHLLLGLLRQADRHGHAGGRISWRHLAELAGCHRATVARNLRRLEELGAVVRVPQYVNEPWIDAQGRLWERRQVESVYCLGPAGRCPRLSQSVRGLIAREVERARRGAAKRRRGSAARATSDVGSHSATPTSPVPGGPAAASSPRAAGFRPSGAAKVSAAGGRPPPLEELAAEWWGPRIRQQFSTAADERPPSVDGSSSSGASGASGGPSGPADKERRG